MARKILLADDSVTAQNMGRRILSDAGYEVVTVNNGSAALKKIPEEKPDLVILDVYMPGYGGMEVCQRLRAAPETAHLPVLLTVGKLEPFKAEEARKVNADAHLVKPFEASELLAALIRLEDKIVPRTDARGSAKSKDKAKSGFEAPAASTSSRQKPGESTASWKSRVKITAEKPVAEVPKEVAKDDTKQVAQETAPQSTAGFHNIEHPSVAPEPAVTAPAATGITPEELAAIAAAAAALGEQSEAPVEPPAAEPARIQDRAPAEFSVSASNDENPFPQRANPYGAMIASVHEQVAHVDAAAFEDSAPAESSADASFAALAAQELAAQETASHESAQEVSVPAAEASASETSEEQTEPVDSRNTVQSAIYSTMEAHDPEMAAALDSLAPVNVDTPGEVDAYVSLIERISASTTPLADLAASGNRWIAAEVPVSAEEANNNLDQEMQTAYAMQLGERAAAGTVDTEAIGEIVAQPLEAHSTAAETTEQSAEVNAHTWADMAWAESNDSPPHPHDLLIAASYAERERNRDHYDDPGTWGTTTSTETSAAEELAPVAETQTEEASASHETADAISETAPEEVAAQPETNAAAWSEEQSEPVAAVAEEHTPASSEISAEIPAEAPAMIDSMIAAVNDNIAAESRQEAAFAAAASSGFGFRSIAHEPAVPQESSASIDSPAHAEIETAEPETAEPAAQATQVGETETPEGQPEEPRTERTPIEEIQIEVAGSAAAEAPAADVPPERAAELAQAWAHWKQIRDSVASPQFTARVAEVAATSLRENAKASAASASASSTSSAPTQASPEASASADSAAIASIVESVLADLKPKLVAEIARKLGREK